jgi:membrane protein YqaA with SNARE-associated domain
MGRVIGKNKQAKEANLRWIGPRFIRILIFLSVLAVAVAIFIYRDRVAELSSYGYLGAFLISVTCSATIILPMPGMLLIFALGAAFHPVFVGLAAAAGGTIGEITGYILGHSGRGLMPSSKIYIKAEEWIRKWGTITIFIFALVPPLPIDIVGIVAGTLRFPLWKFFLACLFGKALLYTGMAFAGALGWEAVLQYFG